MWTFLLTRVLQALFTLWVVSVLVFFAARLTGSPDLALLPPDALPEHRQASSRRMGSISPCWSSTGVGSAARCRVTWARAFSTKSP